VHKVCFSIIFLQIQQSETIKNANFLDLGDSLVIIGAKEAL
jgi:hypothetical protein